MNKFGILNKKIHYLINDNFTACGKSSKNIITFNGLYISLCKECQNKLKQPEINLKEKFDLENKLINEKLQHDFLKARVKADVKKILGDIQ